MFFGNRAVRTEVPEQPIDVRQFTIDDQTHSNLIILRIQALLRQSTSPIILFQPQTNSSLNQLTFINVERQQATDLLHALHTSRSDATTTKGENKRSFFFFNTEHFTQSCSAKHLFASYDDISSICKCRNTDVSNLLSNELYFFENFLISQNCNIFSVSSIFEHDPGKINDKLIASQ